MSLPTILARLYVILPVAVCLLSCGEESRDDRVYARLRGLRSQCVDLLDGPVTAEITDVLHTYADRFPVDMSDVNYSLVITGVVKVAVETSLSDKKFDFTSDRLTYRYARFGNEDASMRPLSTLSIKAVGHFAFSAENQLQIRFDIDSGIQVPRFAYCEGNELSYRTDTMLDRVHDCDGSDTAGYCYATRRLHTGKAEGRTYTVERWKEGEMFRFRACAGGECSVWQTDDEGDARDAERGLMLSSDDARLPQGVESLFSGNRP